MTSSTSDIFEYSNNDVVTFTTNLNLKVHLDYDPLELILKNAVETGNRQHIFYQIIGQSKEDWADMKEYVAELFGPNPGDHPYTLDEDKMVAVMEIRANMDVLGVAVVKNGIPVSIVPLGGTYDT